MARRVIWYGEMGYATEQDRDTTLAAFEAGVANHATHLTPEAWAPSGVAPGIVSPVEAYGLPGFTFSFEVFDGWENTQEWADLSDLAQQPSEGAQQAITTLL